MSTETVCISRAEYEFLKKKAEVNEDLIEQFADSLQDAKAGRIRRVA